jgi:adenylate kinase
MIFAISGSVGSGKTTLSKKLAEEMKIPLWHLNELAEKFKIADDAKDQTFDFDLDAALSDVEERLEKEEHLILEGHFAHFLNPELVDVLVVVNRDLKELKKEYKERGYPQSKIKDNLEVETFNTCFYEALEEGYEEEEQIFCIDSTGKSVDESCEEVLRELKKRGFSW